MQWDYLWADVVHGERELLTGEQGLFGPKKEKKAGWWASLRGTEMDVNSFLVAMGEDGWELVSAVVSQSFTGTASHGGWYTPDHRLYFKRPKA